MLGEPTNFLTTVNALLSNHIQYENFSSLLPKTIKIRSNFVLFFATLHIVAWTIKSVPSGWSLPDILDHALGKIFTVQAVSTVLAIVMCGVFDNIFCCLESLTLPYRLI